MTARQRALCTLTEKMTLRAREMTAADWQPLRDLGFDDQGLLELGHLIALFSYFTRLADGFGLKLHPMLREAAATGVPLKRPGGPVLSSVENGQRPGG